MRYKPGKDMYTEEEMRIAAGRLKYYVESQRKLRSAFKKK